MGRVGLFTLGVVMALSAPGVEEASAKCPPNTPDCSCTRRAPTQPTTHPRDEARLQGNAQVIDLEHVAQAGPSGQLQLMQDERTLRQLSQRARQCLSEEVKMSVVDYSIYMSFIPSSQPLGERLQANSTTLNLIESSIANKLGEDFSCRDMDPDEIQLMSAKAKLYTCLDNPVSEGCNPFQDYIQTWARMPMYYTKQFIREGSRVFFRSRPVYPTPIILR